MADINFNSLADPLTDYIYRMFSLSKYPALEEVQESLSSEQLRILKDQVESEGTDPTPQSQFNYAWGLIKSSNYKMQQEGIKIMSTLYRDVPSMRRECLYYLALGSYKVGDYTNATRYADTLLKNEPDNKQAQTLKATIHDQVTQEGLIGIGIAGGALAIGVGLLGALLRRKR